MKTLADKLVEECAENVDEVKLAGMALFGCENECKLLCIFHAVLIAIVFTISIAIGAYFIYYKYIIHDKKRCF